MSQDHTPAEIGKEDRPLDRSQAEVVAVCISAGGVPKTPVESAELRVAGLEGDGHDHDKHCRPHRALTIQDLELLEDIKAEGYAVGPGIIGENVTVRNLHVQRLLPGDRLSFEGGPIVELTEVRKPCYVLDAVHPDLKDVVVERCGYLARVVQTGRIHPGQRISLLNGLDSASSVASDPGK